MDYDFSKGPLLTVKAPVSLDMLVLDSWVGIKPKQRDEVTVTLTLTEWDMKRGEYVGKGATVYAGLDWRSGPEGSSRRKHFDVFYEESYYSLAEAMEEFDYLEKALVNGRCSVALRQDGTGCLAPQRPAYQAETQLAPATAAKNTLTWCSQPDTDEER